VIEINVGAEFHGLMETTEVDIAGEILDYVAAKARQAHGARAGAAAERGTE
jgi:glutathione synthase/RimK-type ligase-like ATP-grasp enzyme